VVPHIAVGGEGVSSVIGNVIPKSFSTRVHPALEGDCINARQMHLRLLDLIDLLFVEGNPGGIKAALKSRGVCGDAVRLPLVNVSTATYQAIEKELKGLQ
jgi:4-hydroxy-tetrahydrodipicolinate synthase